MRRAHRIWYILVCLVITLPLNSMDNDQEEKNRLLLEECAKDCIEDLSVVQLLIENGADVNTEDKRGYTPLMLSAIKHNQTVLSLLLHNPHIQVNKQVPSALNREEGATALHLAIHHEKPLVLSSTIINLLLLHGADPNIPDETGTSAFASLLYDGYHCWPNRLLEPKNAPKAITLLQHFIDYGANPHVLVRARSKNQDSKNQDPQQKKLIAVLERNSKYLAVTHFLKNACTSSRHLRLQAIYKGDYPTFSNLIKELSPQETDVPYADDRTLLIIAAQHGHISIVQDLLKRGANPTLCNKLKQTAYSLAKKNNHKQTVQLLEKYSKALAGEIMTRCFFSNRTFQQRLPKDVTNLIGLYIMGAE